MSDPSAAPAEALTAALRQLLVPLARLALARGLTHATLDELMKQTLVQVADDALQALPPHRRASRVTTTTGIHRREVTRLLQVLREGGDQAAPAQRSHASELFAHWRSDPQYCSRPGVPLSLPRQGPAPSFEALAQGITRDVHPRSLLDDLVRLGLAEVDDAQDTVRLLRETFVPVGDDARLVQVLGRNVGSHLQAAVDNVLLGPSSHLEQALFANGLSDASLAELRRLAQAQWQALVDTLVPAVEALLARDDGPDAPPGARHRIRLGLYTHQQTEPAPPPDPATTAPRTTP